MLYRLDFRLFQQYGDILLLSRYNHCFTLFKFVYDLQYLTQYVTMCLHLCSCKAFFCSICETFIYLAQSLYKNLCCMRPALVRDAGLQMKCSSEPSCQKLSECSSCTPLPLGHVVRISASASVQPSWSSPSG